MKPTWIESFGTLKNIYEICETPYYNIHRYKFKGEGKEDSENNSVFEKSYEFDMRLKIIVW